MKLVRSVAAALVGLLVDDGLLAVAALAAIGVCWVLSRDGVLGAGLVVGLLLLALLVGAFAVSLSRAVAQARRHR